MSEHREQSLGIESLVLPAVSAAERSPVSTWRVIGGALLALGGLLQSSTAGEPEAGGKTPPAGVSPGDMVPKGGAARPATATCEVIHVGHLHPTSGIPPSQDARRLVVESQLKVIEFLRQNPDAMVISQGTTQLSESAYRSFWSNGTNARMVAANRLFGKGIPKNFEQLSPEQSRMIYDLGAAEVLWLLGEVPAVKRSITEVHQHNLSERVAVRLAALQCEHPELIRDNGTFIGDAMQFRILVLGDPVLRKILVRDQDKETLKSVRALQASGAKKIVLLFDVTHDFDRYQADLPQLAIRRVDMLPEAGKASDVGKK